MKSLHQSDFLAEISVVYQWCITEFRRDESNKIVEILLQSSIAAAVFFRVRRKDDSADTFIF